MTTLHEGWTLTAVGDHVPDALNGLAVPATVPGCVHTDLLAAGLIEDPYHAAGETAAAALFGLDWRYTRPLRLDPAVPGERVELVFDGLDTVATVALGGEVLGSSVNMHRSYRYDVTGYADGVERELIVDLASATRYALAEQQRLGLRPSAYPDAPYNYVRKMACSFGWDWGPDLRTAGIWKPVRLERWSTARLAGVRPLVGVDADGTGTVEVLVDLARIGGAELTLTAAVAGRRVEVTVPDGATTASVLLRVPDAPLWWPAGYGDQPLSELTVEVRTGAEVLDAWARRIGFRTVELDTGRDELGTAFTLKVNGRPLFIKGANWIPDDHFVTRITRERLAARLDQALGANLNLLRVWGGGIYETDDFYELADERGLLVWQDFLLACAAYPEEQPLAAELEAEARENVGRLMPHPSLVLWNGGNENLWGYEDWGWPERLQGRSWGEGYARDLLRAVVADVDPTRPYADNSPCSPGFAGDVVHPNDPDHGSHHQWEVWNRIDYTAYRDEIPRFCSEFGFQGPPTWATLAAHLPASDGGPLEASEDPWNDPVWLVHQKAEDGNGKLDRGMTPHLGRPAGFTDWLWAAQLNQARAVRYAIEHYRSWWPRTAGAIVWQLNDCWPVTSWAAIDGEGRAKPLWYALAAANAPRTLCFVERDGSPTVAVLNDTDQAWRGTLALRRETLPGERLATASVTVDVPARAVGLVPLAGGVAAWGDVTGEAVVAELDGVRAVHTGVEDVDLRLDPDAVSATAEACSDGYLVTVTATALVRDVTLLADRAEVGAVVDGALVTLPAGSSHTFRVRCPALPDPAVLTRTPVLRSANDLRGVPQASAPMLEAVRA